MININDLLPDNMTIVEFEKKDKQTKHIYTKKELEFVCVCKVSDKYVSILDKNNNYSGEYKNKSELTDGINNYIKTLDFAAYTYNPILRPSYVISCRIKDHMKKINFIKSPYSGLSGDVYVYNNINDNIMGAGIDISVVIDDIDHQTIDGDSKCNIHIVSTKSQSKSVFCQPAMEINDIINSIDDILYPFMISFAINTLQTSLDMKPKYETEISNMELNGCGVSVYSAKENIIKDLEAALSKLKETK